MTTRCGCAGIVYCVGHECPNAATSKCSFCADHSVFTPFCCQACCEKNKREHDEVHRLLMVISVLRSQNANLLHFADNISKPGYYYNGLPVSQRTSPTHLARHVPILYTQTEISSIRAACRICRKALDAVAAKITPGVATTVLDGVAHDVIITAGAYPAPYNYYGFSHSVFISVNETMCYGTPSSYKLKDGDIIKVDVAVFFKGFYGGLCETFTVGKADDVSRRLVQTADKAVIAAIQVLRKTKAFFSDFGDAISDVVSSTGFSVVESYLGHGIGSFLHCEPDIPHYATTSPKILCLPGMVFTIGPIISAGNGCTICDANGLNVISGDQTKSSQFAHTVLVTIGGYEILTARQ